MRLSEFVFQVLFRRSLRDWRTVRATRWEIVVAVLWTTVVLYAFVVGVTTAVDTQCLWNRSGPKCEGGWFR